MTIDEAINIAKSDIKYNKSIGCDTSYEEQLVEWLEELKCYKNDNDFSDYADRLHKIAFNSGYNKALDDFVNTVKATFPHDNIAICNTYVIAKKLKAGGENEQKTKSKNEKRVIYQYS